MVDHVDLGLADADRLEEHVVAARRVHQQRGLQRRLGQPAERAARGHRADEDARVEEVLGEADAVAEQRAAAERRATGRSRARRPGGRARGGGATSAPISVDLPAPGGPVKPTTAARAGLADRSRARAPSPRGSSSSTSEMPRASARLSPASSRSARVAFLSAMGAASWQPRRPGWRPALGSTAWRRSPTDPAAACAARRRRSTAARSRSCASCAAHGMLNRNYARLALRWAWLKLRWRGRLETDGLCFVGPGVKFEIGRGAAVGSAAGRGSATAEDPRARGRGRDRREDRARPGVHDLLLPARLDRPRVHRRRPRDADRLRPRRGRDRPPDPPAGDLQARRQRRPQLLDRLRRVHPARRDRRRQRDRRDEHASSPRTCPPTRSSAACPARVLRMRDEPERMRWR